jgi:hypothetical protein
MHARVPSLIPPNYFVLGTYLGKVPNTTQAVHTVAHWGIGCNRLSFCEPAGGDGPVCAKWESPRTRSDIAGNAFGAVLFATRRDQHATGAPQPEMPALDMATSNRGGWYGLRLER